MKATSLGRNVRYIGESFWLCLFPGLSVTLALVALLGVPQGKEVLEVITDARLRDTWGYPFGLAHYVIFLLAFFAWGAANWYAARVVLQRDFTAVDSEEIPREPDTPLVAKWRVWFPRALGLLGTLPIAISILCRGQWCAGSFAVATSALLLAFVITRRKVFGVVERAESLRIELGNGDRIALWLTLSLSFVLLFGLSAANYWLARFLGAPAIVFLGLSSTTLFGSLVLIYLPKAYGWPSMVWVPILLFFAFAQLGLNRNHRIDSRLVLTDSLPARPRVSAHFAAWLKDRGNGPIYLIAAEGGASRSAWWTAHVLGSLDYATYGAFSKRVFAVSGISGGSLGAATYAALLAHREPPRAAQSAAGELRFPTYTDCEKLFHDAGEFPLPMQSECFLGRDFLSPTIGYLVYPDFVQRFLPFAVKSWDRSLGLEETWEKDWFALFGTHTFEEPIEKIYADSSNSATMRTDVPIILLNSARAGAGRAVLQSPVLIPDSELQDLFMEGLRTSGLRLSTAVHNSSRFPIVSPGGDVARVDGTHWDALVDGGYFENSGAAALLEMLRAIERDYKNTGRAGDWEAVRARIQVLFIVNNPDGPPPESAACQGADANSSSSAGEIKQEELLTAVIGLYASRSARADSSKRALVAYLGACARGHTISPASADVKKVRPSLAWYMTPESRIAMWSAVGESPAIEPLCVVLKEFPESPQACERLKDFSGHKGATP